MVTNSSIILFVVTGALCMTSLFAVTNVVCKVAGRCLVLMLAPCSCDFILWGLTLLESLGCLTSTRSVGIPSPAPRPWLSLPASVEVALTHKPVAWPLSAAQVVYPPDQLAALLDVPKVPHPLHSSADSWPTYPSNLIFTVFASHPSHSFNQVARLPTSHARLTRSIPKVRATLLSKSPWRLSASPSLTHYHCRSVGKTIPFGLD